MQIQILFSKQVSLWNVTFHFKTVVLMNTMLSASILVFQIRKSISNQLWLLNKLLSQEAKGSVLRMALPNVQYKNSPSLDQPNAFFLWNNSRFLNGRIERSCSIL